MSARDNILCSLATGKRKTASSLILGKTPSVYKTSCSPMSNQDVDHRLFPFLERLWAP